VEIQSPAATQYSKGADKHDLDTPCHGSRGLGRERFDRKSDEARFLEVRLKREENRVEEALPEAIALAGAMSGSQNR
jgi:hypothetical protein